VASDVRISVESSVLTWIRGCNKFVKRIEEYLEYSNRERVKYGVLDGADVHSFDVVVFVSLVIRYCFNSVHVRVAGWIWCLVVLSVSVSAVPHHCLDTDTNGITV